MNLMEITKGYEPKQNEQTDQTKNSLYYYRQAGSCLRRSRQKSLEKADGGEGRITGEKFEKMNEFIQKFQERTHRRWKMEKQNLFFENHEIARRNSEIKRTKFIV